MSEYPHNRGADLAAACHWKNNDGSDLNLTGVTLSAFEVIPATLQPFVTFTITGAVGGLFTTNLPWNSSWPPNVGNVVHIGVQTNGSPKKAFEFDVVLI